MFIEKEKRRAETELIGNVKDVVQKYFPSNWEKVIIFNEFYNRSYSGRFILIFDDNTFIDSTQLYLFSNVDKWAVASIGTRFAKIFLSAYDMDKVDKKNPLNIVTMELARNGEYSFSYYENLGDYKYDTTPFAVWTYKIVGFKDLDSSDKEVEHFIKKYNIVPEQVLKPRVFSVELKVLLENMLIRNIYSIATYLPLNITKIYFHVDRVCGKTKFSIYIKTKEGKWIKEKNVQKAHGDYANQKLIFAYWDWVETFNYMHIRCKRTIYSFRLCI